jgi:hypothetical protein
MSRPKQHHAWPPCDVCGEEVDVKEGYLGLSTSQLNQYRQQYYRWKEAHSDGSVIMIGNRADDPPDRVPWYWGHWRCMPPDVKETEDWFDAKDIDTPEKALWHTRFMSQKRWIGWTTWAETLSRLYPPSFETKKKAQRQPLTLRRRFEVLSRDHFRCRYCGRDARDTVLEVDHVVPIAKGGTDSMENLATACIECNRSKRDLLVAVTL